jgi:hypothetical protein
MIFVSLKCTLFDNSLLCVIGGVGIENMIVKMENHEYMGFEDLCTQS